MRSFSFLRGAVPLAALLVTVGCGRTELETGPLPDAGVPVDVPGDRPDTTPDGGRCFANLDCDDGVFCNGAEACVDGRCTSAPPINCDDGLACTADRCVESARTCENAPDNTRCPAPGRCDVMRGCVTDGCVSDAACDDGNLCNGQELCRAGLCVRTPPPACDDGLDCTVDRCEPGVGCVSRPDNTRCDNGQFCDGAETCLPGVGCAPGRPVLCDDGNDCTVERCDERLRACASMPGPVDLDGDGVASARCGGADCDDTDRSVNPGAPERCADGRDNNCDGRVDCADRACAATPDCAMCVPTGPEADPMSCADGRDNDCNGATDCRDIACARLPACAMCVPTGPETGAACADLRDNDCDGFTDCSDFDCRTSLSCQTCVPTGPEDNPMACADGRDNDCDRLTDCADRDCARAPSCAVCTPTGPEVCGDGRDNDCNGAIDCADRACVTTPSCVTIPNDTCGAPAVLSLPGRATGVTTGARNDFDPSCVNPGGPDVVYVLRNPTRQTITLDTEGSAFDTALQVFRDRCGDPAAVVACDDDSGAGVTSRVVIPNAEPGTYFIVLDGFGGSNGAYVLNARLGATEVCDNLTDDDGDGAVDCRDPDCAAFPACRMCVPTGMEFGSACFDGRDNDCNGLTDCADASCVTQPACCRPTGIEGDATTCFDGRDNDCDGNVDCNDSGCRFLPRCCVFSGAEGSPASCTDGRDNDCNGLTDCRDPRCLTQPFCCTPSGAENNLTACRDGRDNDCDGRSDCNDSECAALPVCCTPTGPESGPMACLDGRDNDCNGATDCADRGCIGAPGCGCVPSPEACADGRDNDCDNLADCSDQDCAAAPNCVARPPNDLCSGAIPIGVPSTTVGTSVGATNDASPVLMGFPGCAGGAGLDVVYALRVTRAATLTLQTAGRGFDTVLYVRRDACESGAQVACNDDTNGLDSQVTFAATPGTYYVFVDGFGDGAAGVFSLSVREGAPSSEVCNNSFDDDGDGAVDCADTDCATSPLCACVPTPESDARTCADGIDEDCDRQVDCADPDCASTVACCRPTAPREFGVAACTDGIDNDCDGTRDCADSDCQPSRAMNAECCNGRDENGNGLVDEFACACDSAVQCRGVGNGGPFPSNTCWSTTFRVCAPSCNLLGGNSFCANFFRGTTCDNASGECR